MFNLYYFDINCNINPSIYEYYMNTILPLLQLEVEEFLTLS